MGLITDILEAIFGNSKRSANSGSNADSYKFGSETEAAIRRLLNWQRQRISDIDSSYSTYCPESGEEIYLWKMKIPQNGFSSATISDQVKQFWDNLIKEIENFRSYAKKLSTLNFELRKDDFFPEIDHLFANKLKRLYNELLFCKVAELSEYEYYNSFFSIINAIYDDLKILNSAFIDYMYALSQTEFENNKQDLELIRIRVDSMRQAAQKSMD